MRDTGDGELDGELLVLVLERDDYVAAGMCARLTKEQ
jgi:hypothetical protein